MLMLKLVQVPVRLASDVTLRFCGVYFSLLFFVDEAQLEEGLWGDGSSTDADDSYSPQTPWMLLKSR